LKKSRRKLCLSAKGEFVASRRHEHRKQLQLDDANEGR
jgi:hypothetical protein